MRGYKFFISIVCTVHVHTVHTYIIHTYIHVVYLEGCLSSCFNDHAVTLDKETWMKL